jgi:hypothetical protein
MTGARGERRVHRSEPVVREQEELSGAEILADLPRMGTLCWGRDLDRPVGAVPDVLTHDDGVPPGGHHVAGVDRVVLVREQDDRRAGVNRVGDGIARVDRDTVHRGDRVGGDRPSGMHSLRSDSTDRILDRDRLGGKQHLAARPGARGQPGRQRGLDIQKSRLSHAR